MYSTHYERKADVAERFVRTLNTEVYRYMTSVSTNVYIDELNDTVNEYNNIYHRKIRAKGLLMLKIMFILILVKKLMINI